MAIDYRAYARQMAVRYGIDPDIFERQIQRENQFNPIGTSPAGASGIAQFMPATARGLGLDTSDPLASLDAAAKMMAGFVKQYGRYDLALAAYNSGPGNVATYGGVPPFKETQTYLKDILGDVGDKADATTAYRLSRLSGEMKLPNYAPEPVRAAQGLMAGSQPNPGPASLPYARPLTGTSGNFQDDPMLTSEENMRRRYTQLPPYRLGG